MIRVAYEWLKDQGHYIMRKIILIDRNSGEDLERMPEIPVSKSPIARLKKKEDEAESRRKNLFFKLKGKA